MTSFLGRSVHPLYWNAIWREVYEYLVEAGVLIPEAMDRARLRAYRLLSPFCIVIPQALKKAEKKLGKRTLVRLGPAIPTRHCCRCSRNRVGQFVLV